MPVFTVKEIQNHEVSTNLGVPGGLVPFRLLAEVISLAWRRFKQRKYVPSGVTVVEIDKSSIELTDPPSHTSVIGPAPEPRAIATQAELEALFGKPQGSEHEGS